jgi:hypothetical protein
MIRKFFWFIGLCVFVYAQEVPSVEHIRGELNTAEEDFKIAKKMFNPWYGGPLLTGSGNTLSPGLVNIQPYLFVIDNYAAFDGERKAHSIHDLVVVNPVFSLQIGIVKRVDVTLNLQGLYQKQRGKSSGNMGDTTLSMGYSLLFEKPYVPAVKLSLKESFPTGKYQHLESNKPGVDSTGSGSFETTVGLNISKVVWWSLTHPMQFRLSLNYDIPARVLVGGFNSYGGGFGTKGKVNPGNSFIGCFGYEFSCSQKIVLAIDVDYVYNNKTTFRGNDGLNSDGSLAITGNPSKDILSLAPALEYNFTPDLAFIGGAWLSVWGRNNNDFISGIVTVTYTF